MTELCKKYNLLNAVDTYVRVRSDLVLGRLYDRTCLFTSDMTPYRGQVKQVIGRKRNPWGKHRLVLEGLPGYVWSLCMVDHIN